MRAYFVVSVVGSDRPGIVDEISRIVADGGCNIDDSRMAHLGGEFAMMMLLSGEGDSPGRVAARIEAWAAGQEMTAVTRPTTGPVAEPGAAAQIGLEMPDQPEEPGRSVSEAYGLNPRPDRPYNVAEDILATFPTSPAAGGSRS